MYFQARDAIDHMRARRLKRLSPPQVVLLVKARLELNKHHHLLALFRRIDQRLDDRRTLPYSIERHADRYRLFVVCRLLDKAHDRLEAIEGVIEQDILLFDRLVDIFGIERR